MPFTHAGDYDVAEPDAHLSPLLTPGAPLQKKIWHNVSAPSTPYDAIESFNLGL